MEKSLYITKTGLPKNGVRPVLNITGFTLVELIVVITILAILGTIAILAFSGYSKNARDSARVSDIGNMKKSLELWILQSGTYPEPTNSIDITYLGSPVWSQGTFGDSVLSTVGKLDKKPIDPLYSVDYTYSVTKSRKEYQIGAVLEGDTAYSPIVSQTYAASSGLAYIGGNYNGILATSGVSPVYILALPSIILSQTPPTELNNIDGSLLVYEGKSNIPESYKKSGLTMTGSDFSFTPVAVWSGTGINELNNQEIFQTLVTNLQTVYNSGSLFASLPEYEKIAGDVISVEAMTSVKTLIEKNTSEELTQVDTTPVVYDCTFNNEVVENGVSVIAYSETNIAWNAPYDCNSKKITRTCTSGTLSGETSYTYGICVKGTPQNCSANSNYTLNGHTYSVPQTNHGDTISVSSINVTENNGLFTYSLNVTCNDGTVNQIEEITPSLVSCNAGYSQSGNSCIQNACSTTLPSCSSLSCTTTVGTPTSPNQSWVKDASSCGYVCSNGYTGNDCTTPAIYTFGWSGSLSDTNSYTKTSSAKTHTVGSNYISADLAGGTDPYVTLESNSVAFSGTKALKKFRVKLKTLLVPSGHDCWGYYSQIGYTSASGSVYLYIEDSKSAWWSYFGGTCNATIGTNRYDLNTCGAGTRFIFGVNDGVKTSKYVYTAGAWATGYYTIDATVDFSAKQINMQLYDASNNLFQNLSFSNIPLPSTINGTSLSNFSNLKSYSHVHPSCNWYGSPQVQTMYPMVTEFTPE